MDFNEEQPLNGASFILDTVDGIVIFFNDVQFLKAPFPIFFKPSCKSTDAKLRQPLNTRSSILVTVSGI